MATLSDIQTAVWGYGSRTRASGSANPTDTPLHSLVASVWSNPTRTLTSSPVGDMYVTKDAWGFQYILNTADPLYVKFVTYQGCKTSSTPFTLSSDPSVNKTVFPGGGNTDRGYRWH